MIGPDLSEQSCSMVTSQPESELQVRSLSRLGCGGPGTAAMLAPGSCWNNDVSNLNIIQSNRPMQSVTNCQIKLDIYLFMCYMDCRIKVANY